MRVSRLIDNKSEIRKKHERKAVKVVISAIRDYLEWERKMYFTNAYMEMIKSLPKFQTELKEPLLLPIGKPHLN